MSEDIPISEQANVPGGLMSFDPGTIPGQRPPNFGKQVYSRIPRSRAMIFEAMAQAFIDERDANRADMLRLGGLNSS